MYVLYIVYGDQFCILWALFFVHFQPMQEEDAKKAAKENAKENKRKAKNGEDAKEVPMRRPAAAKPPKAPKEKASPRSQWKKGREKG